MGFIHASWWYLPLSVSRNAALIRGRGLYTIISPAIGLPMYSGYVPLGSGVIGISPYSFPGRF